MDGSIPLHLERELELIGVLNRTPLDDHEDLPQPNVFEFKHVELDENGEPPW
jgi:hypothetical protein